MRGGASLHALYGERSERTSDLSRRSLVAEEGEHRPNGPESRRQDHAECQHPCFKLDLGWTPHRIAIHPPRPCRTVRSPAEPCPDARSCKTPDQGRERDRCGIERTRAHRNLTARTNWIVLSSSLLSEPHPVRRSAGSVARRRCHVAQGGPRNRRKARQGHVCRARPRKWKDGDDRQNRALTCRPA